MSSYQNNKPPLRRQPTYNSNSYNQHPAYPPPSPSRFPIVPRGECNPYDDIQELLKKEIYSQGQQQPPNNYSSSTPSNNTVVSSGPSYGFEDIEIYFDSVSSSSFGNLLTGEIGWSITAINNTNDIRNCIQVNLGRFFFPKISQAINYPEFFYYRRVFMELTSFPTTQAVLAPNNNRFHFEFEVININGHAVELSPIKNSYFFPQPISSISDFNIRFLVPTFGSTNNFTHVPIPQSRVPIQCIPGTNPIQFSITSGDTTTLTFGPIGPVALPGYAVNITNFASNDPAVNAAVNNPLCVFVSNIIDDYTFEIGTIDGTTVGAAYSADMFIPKNRIAFPVRFTSVKSQITNYIGVNHL